MPDIQKAEEQIVVQEKTDLDERKD